MESFSSFNAYIQRAIIDNWDQDALTDYQGATLQFHDVARKIEKLHILFENSNVQKGQIQNIVNHSESKILFIGDFAVKTINPDEMPALEGIINIPDFSLMISRSEQLTYAREHLNMMFGSKYPMAFRREHVSYHQDGAEELALINYTSGTTGYSKGVMLPYRTIWGNIEFIINRLGKTIKPGDNLLSILPMAHMYGMAVEFLFGFCHGCHLFFLTRLPSPAIIAQAFLDVRPTLIVTVPLILEKIIRKKVFPKIQNNRMRLLLAMPVVSKKVKDQFL